VLAYVSLWSADLLALGEAVDRLSAVVDGFHVDVFDGHNVPDLLFGPDLVAALRRRTGALLDIHLNVTDPDHWARRFVDAGADMVTVQGRASPDIGSTLGLIDGLGAQPSLGLETDEPVATAVAHLGAVRRVLLMGTAIGVKGVGLDPQAPARVAALVEARGRLFPAGGGPLVVVDGGIRDHTVEALAAAGADGVVPGSLVFGTPDPAAAVHRLHALAGPCSAVPGSGRPPGRSR
jgi:ribulose-phosphate 3-epimerase